MEKVKQDYKYKFQYIYGDKIVTHAFSADIEINDLIYYLRDFLCGCSWSEDIVNNMLNLGEE